MRFLIIFCSLFFSFAAFANSKIPAQTPHAPFEWDYEFGRPVRPDETTYIMYRQRHAEDAKKMGFDPKVIADGMDTWHWWVGVDNPGFWQDLVHLTGSPHNPTELRLDLFRILMITPRAERFKRLGLINDPDCVAADKPDQFGLTLDRMKDGTLQWDPDVFGYESGVIGLQLFKNEKFDPKKWSPDAYLKDGSKIEPPYKVGMACIFCHIGFNPDRPPANPEEPKWENLTSTIGNQYLREGLAFATNQSVNSIVYQYLAIQEPGTSETSRFPMDFINNPTNISSIFRLKDRLKVAHVENITPAQAKLIKSMYKDANLSLDDASGSLGGTDDHPTMKVPHVLTDGADSMGIMMASARVYVNEGMMHDLWYNSLPVNFFNIKKSLFSGFKPKEFDLFNEARKDPNSPWMQTERRMPNMATFLMTYDSFPLKDAVEANGGKPGKDYLSSDEEILHRGKIVFADTCAECHSSKAPNPMPTDVEDQKKAWRELVLRKDFLKDNYLSDDARHSVTEVGTNSQRAEGTNAMAGWTWGQMSSQTYKDQRKETIELADRDAKGNSIPLYNPLTGKNDIHWKGRNAFYRTPTLVSIWATAPFLHNNALGKYTGDPSIKGRMESFQDSIEKMLWPEKRDGIKSVKVTTAETNLPDIFQALKPHLKKFDQMDLKILHMPAGTPINLFLNLHPKNIPAVIGAYLDGVLQGRPHTEYKTWLERRREAGLEAMKKKMLELSTVPDFVEDRGHTFGSTLSDADKKALIEYMKYF